MLRCYRQHNNQPLLVSLPIKKDVANATGQLETLKCPIDYSLVWSSKLSKIKQNGPGYIWYPIPHDGYEAVGYVVITIPEKPPLDKVRCIRSNLLRIVNLIIGFGVTVDQ
ncbi:hypothetical protein ACH5RR_039192 [Cinchona calisaya]|uniref:Uncharacterized protein n=1 Tax=Cinchona calisaya TaxID=153742 RepID=A0ABD2XXK1_9GENT